MSQDYSRDYSTTCRLLKEQMDDAMYRVRSTRANQTVIDSQMASIKELTDAVAGCNAVLRWLKPYMTVVQDYLAERRSASLQSVNNAIRLAGEIIPDANVGARLNIEGKDAWLSTSDDLDLQLTEGGGYRNITSTFLRMVILGANQSLLQTVVLDEVAAAVSPENSATLSS